MGASESDIVLSAVRRGEETLPKLKAATGIDYAVLQRILYSLEMTTVRKEESFEGFARYYPATNGTKPSDHHDKPVSVHPSYNRRTDAAATADEAAIEQRNAPYCVKCRAVCLLHGADRNGRRRWKCRPCNQTFLGSGEAKRFHERKAAVAHIDEHEEGEQRVREIVEAGTPATYKVFDKGEHVLADAAALPKFSISKAVRDVVTDWPDGVDLSQPLVVRCILRDHPEIRPSMVRIQLKAQVAGLLSRLADRGDLTVKTEHHGVTPAVFLKARKEAAQNGGGAVKVNVAKLSKATGAKSAASEFVRDAFCLSNCDPAGIGHHFKCTYFPMNQPRIEIDFEHKKATVASPAGENPAVQIDGDLNATVGGSIQFNLNVNLASYELNAWGTEKIAEFFQAIAIIVAAGR